MSVVSTIEKKLREAFAPDHLEVRDDSHLHAGHMGARPEGETHFHVEITAKAFAGLNRVAQQRAINKVLVEELAGPVHALQLKVLK
jgi:BolA protein